jgi:Na+/H+-dicarboxylate symporter
MSDAAEKKRKKIPLSIQMLIAMVLGLIAGRIIGPDIAVIKPFGTLFLNLLRMCMMPIIFTSIVLSVASVTDFKTFGKIGGRMFFQFIITSAVAACVGTFLGSVLQPGAGFQLQDKVELTMKKAPGVADTLLSIIPTNPISAMVNNDLLATIFFSVFLGICLILIGDKKAPVINILESLFNAFLRMIRICLMYAPIGVFALMAVLSGQQGLEVLKPLSKFFLTEYIAILFQLIVVYGIVLYATTRLNIFRFLYRLKSAIVVAFTTASGNAALPVLLEESETHYGIPDEIAGFGLTVGATINQDGAALNIPICVLFTAQVYGFQFTTAQLVTILVMAIVMSCGSSGVPASATVFTLSILSSFGIPIEAFSIVLASYIIIDVGLTTINVVGDVVCVAGATKFGKRFNTKVWERGYNADEALRQKLLNKG